MFLGLLGPEIHAIGELHTHTHTHTNAHPYGLAGAGVPSAVSTQPFTHGKCVRSSRRTWDLKVLLDALAGWPPFFCVCSSGQIARGIPRGAVVSRSPTFGGTEASETCDGTMAWAMEGSQNGGGYTGRGATMSYTAANSACQTSTTTSLGTSSSTFSGRGNGREEEKMKRKENNRQEERQT